MGGISLALGIEEVEAAGAAGAGGASGGFAPVPELPKGVDPLKVGHLVDGFAKSFFESDMWRATVLKMAEHLTPHQQALMSTWRFKNKAYVLKRIAEIHATVEEESEPELLAVLAQALGHIFGVTVSPETLLGGLRAGGGEGAGTAFGSILVQSLFSGFAGGETPPEGEGIHNLERLLNGIMRTSMAAWAGDMVKLGFLSEDLPEAAKLHEAIESGIGLSRLAGRALRPLIQQRIEEPLTRDLNRQFRPKRATAAQLVKLLAAHRITDDEYLDAMAEQGYPDELAEQFKKSESKDLGEDTIKRAHFLGLFDDAECLERLAALGYVGENAQLIIATWKRDNVGKPYERLITVARDMFVSRETDEDGLRTLLEMAGLPEMVRDQWVAVCTIERARPRLLTKGDAEAAYTHGVWDETQLRAWYRTEGYSDDSADALVAMSSADKVKLQRADAKLASELPPAPVDAVREATAKEAFRRGLIPLEALTRALSALGISGDRESTEIAVLQGEAHDYQTAVKRQQEADQGVRVSAGAVEDAFVHGLATDETLHAFYTERGFPESEWPLYLLLQQDRRGIYLARIAKQRTQAAGATTKPKAT